MLTGFDHPKILRKAGLPGMPTLARLFLTWGDAGPWYKVLFRKLRNWRQPRCL